MKIKLSMQNVLRFFFCSPNGSLFLKYVHYFRKRIFFLYTCIQFIFYTSSDWVCYLFKQHSPELNAIYIRPRILTT